MDLVELSRRLENLLRIGTIHAVDHAAVRCRVQSGGLLSNWLLWHTPRAGATTTWDPPTVGEQCLVLSPSGEPGNGVVFYGLNSDLVPPPSHSPDDQVINYPDGTILRYDHAAGIHEALYPDGSEIRYTHPDSHLEVLTPGTINVTAAKSITVQSVEAINIVAAAAVSIVSTGGSDTKIAVSGNTEISTTGFTQYLSEGPILIHSEAGIRLHGAGGVWDL